MNLTTTYGDVLRPQSRVKGFVYDVLLVIAGSILLALSARVVINLPFSPVPITGQTFAVLFLGMLYGKARGTATVLTYLGQGLAGLPVFANGLSGVAILASPTVGYLVGFAVAAYVVGWLAERHWDRGVVTTAGAMLTGNLVIYSFGVFWLSRLMGSVPAAITAGVTPFIIGDILKIALATALLPSGWALLRRLERQ